MTIDIFVVRGAGDRRGEDVVDPLVSALPVAIQRGRNELDGLSSAPQTVSAETVYRPGVRTGQLARFCDSQSGSRTMAKIMGVTHEVRKVGDSVQISTTLRLRRPTDYYA